MSNLRALLLVIPDLIRDPFPPTSFNQSDATKANQIVHPINKSPFPSTCYTNLMKTVSVIKVGGQLTIPDSISKLVNWITPHAKVTISIIKPDEIRLKPHNIGINNYNWDAIWTHIKAARKIKGLAGISASKILEVDRHN